MPNRLREASFEVIPGRSPVVPLIIDGLPEQMDVLGTSWQRKREFHMTVASAALLEDVAGPDVWERAVRALSGRSIGAMYVGRELRRVRDRERPGLETIVVMVEAPGLGPIYDTLSAALGSELTPPPAHVTLYSTDPAEGIGLKDLDELHVRAPELSDSEQEEIRRAMRFEEVFG